MPTFVPNCLPLLIGSLPINSHSQAMDLIMKYTPSIPLWPQLPTFEEEGMVPQFISGMPGIDVCDETTFINAQSEAFEAEFLSFYEEYLAVTEGGGDLDETRFVLNQVSAKGFFEFLDRTRKAEAIVALKAQTTGPFTFATGIVDHNNRIIFYDEQLRDCASKLLALKARWQLQQMNRICPNSIMIFDEPAMAGFGSSAFISISADDVTTCFTEVIEAVHDEGAIAGVHVCANTEWSVLFDAGIDLVSFDAYSYFDKFILYPEHIRAFFAKGGLYASGIIPTTTELIEIENSDSLTAKWLEQAGELVKIGIPMEQITAQTLITPSCGTGSISLELATRVMEMTRQVSKNLRDQFSLS